MDWCKLWPYFPGLINGCTIDWFLPWPQEALIAVSTKFIGDFSMACSNEDKFKLQEHMGNVHVAVGPDKTATAASLLSPHDYHVNLVS